MAVPPATSEASSPNPKATPIAQPWREFTIRLQRTDFVASDSEAIWTAARTQDATLLLLAEKLADVRIAYVESAHSFRQSA